MGPQVRKADSFVVAVSNPTNGQAMKVTIDRAVPIPSRKRNKKPILYPFAKMAPGDSFEVQTEEDINDVRNAIQSYKSERPEARFITRETTSAMDAKVGQRRWRCWRVPNQTPGQEDTDTE